MACPGIKQRRTLGANAGWIGGILLIATLDNLAVGKQCGCPHAKTGIGRISPLTSVLGAIDQFFLLLRQFILTANEYICNDIGFFHTDYIVSICTKIIVSIGKSNIAKPFFR